MSWTDITTIKKHLADIDRVVTEFRDVPVTVGSDGSGQLPHRGILSGTVAIKRIAALAPDTETSVALTGEGWTNLAHSQLMPGEIVVSGDSSLTTVYLADVDYVADFAEGRIRRISGGAIPDSSTVTVSYRRYTLLTESVDYTVNLSGGTFSRVSGGDLNPDVTVYADYEVSAGCAVDDLAETAIAEAEDKIAARLKSDYSTASTDQGLVTGATELSLAIICRALAARAVTDSVPGAEGRGKIWLELAARYEQAATVTLRPFVESFPVQPGSKKSNASWEWV